VLIMGYRWDKVGAEEVEVVEKTGKRVDERSKLRIIVM